jgi:hypothetical protein
MYEILTWILSILTTNTQLNAIVPVAQVFTGPVDVVELTQSGLNMPMIILTAVSEAQVTVPQGSRDTEIQIDIWSRNSMLECVNIYEQIVTLLSYQSANQTTAYIFWNRLGGATDIISEDRRMFHRAATFRFWSQKP